MRQASKRVPESAEKTVRDIRRATRRHHSAEEKIRIVLEGLRGEDSIAELCRKEGIVREMIEAAGATLLYLPPYSPDLNPIEQAFSKLKAHLRKAAETTVPGLLRRIGRLLATFSPQECRNFLRHAGYVQT
jgi:transposase